MTGQYGTKAWATWASNNLRFALMLLQDPDKQWDAELLQIEAAVKSLNILNTELKAVLPAQSPGY